MNVILGFGSTEAEAERAIFQEIFDALGFDAQDPNTTLKEIERKYHEAAERYDKMSADKAPPRYSQFWAFAHKVYDNYFICLTIGHTSRQHALAPEGWAGLYTKWLLAIDRIEGARVYRLHSEIAEPPRDQEAETPAKGEG